MRQVVFRKQLVLPQTENRLKLHNGNDSSRESKQNQIKWEVEVGAIGVLPKRRGNRDKQIFRLIQRCIAIEAEDAPG